ncbi:hypothetical protein EZY14_016415 [Kordia sp. TARA_039_SRF]|nr:hypothetical protein EZY14_016415 [Kordia sp. TARA_039_SRF]
MEKIKRKLPVSKEEIRQRIEDLQDTQTYNRCNRGQFLKVGQVICISQERSTLMQLLNADDPYHILMFHPNNVMEIQQEKMMKKRKLKALQLELEIIKPFRFVSDEINEKIDFVIQQKKSGQWKVPTDENY